MKKVLRISTVCIYFICILVILFEACLPGKASANQSDKVSGDIAGIIDSIKPNDKVEVVYPESIKLEEINNFHVGEQRKLGISFLPKNTNYKKVEYIIGDEKIIKVHNNICTALKEGTTSLEVKLEGKNISDKINLTVLPKEKVDLQSFEVSYNDHIYIQDQNSSTSKINIIKNPINADIDNIEYEIENKDILKINHNIISGLKEGTTSVLIKVSSNGHVLTKKINLTVIKKHLINPSNINIDIPDKLYISRKVKFKTSLTTNRPITENEYIDQNVTYELKDDLGRFLEDGMFLPIKEGKTILKVSSVYDPNIYKEIEINIYPVLIEKITVNLDNKYKVGDRVKLEYKIYPEDATNKEIHFSANNKNIEISNDGEISAIKKGSSVIKITDAEGNVLKELNLNILKAPIFTEDEWASFRLFVRKAIGHFGAFFITGIFGFFAARILLKKNKFSLLLSVGLGVATAVSSELLQLIPEGRGCSFKDMCIDTAGYLLSTLICLLILGIILLVKKSKNRKHAE